MEKLEEKYPLMRIVKKDGVISETLTSDITDSSVALVETVDEEIYMNDSTLEHPAKLYYDLYRSKTVSLNELTKDGFKSDRRGQMALQSLEESRDRIYNIYKKTVMDNLYRSEYKSA